jgi:hypothetical protein
MVKTGRGKAQVLQFRPIELQASHFVFNDLAQTLEAIFTMDGNPAKDVFR